MQLNLSVGIKNAEFHMDNNTINVFNMLLWKTVWVVKPSLNGWLASS